MFFLYNFIKLILFSGLVFSTWNLVFTRPLMPKIFWLISLFVELSFLLLLHGVEFISFIILLLYVGAISILFLFVVMILNPDSKVTMEKKKTEISLSNIGLSVTPVKKETKFSSEFIYYFDISVVVCFFSFLIGYEVFAFEFYSYLQGLWVHAWPILSQYTSLSVFHNNLNFTDNNWGVIYFSGVGATSDLWFIAHTFYTEDFVAFWIVGLILLSSMIGTILLTLQKSRGIKHQLITNQTKRYYVFQR